MYFNPRSREGSDTAGHADRAVRDHFNPRSREGSDCIRGVNNSNAAISIHAPAKGATCDADIAGWLSGNFNPRSREGSDKARFQLIAHVLDISIHAPAKGATCRRLWISLISQYISIHAPAKGATRQPG